MTGMIHQPRANGVKPRLLVLHDVQETRRAFKEALAESGFDVEVAEDETVALEALRRRHPNAVVISLERTPLDVIRLGIQLREEAGLGQTIPLIVIPVVRTPLEAVNIPMGYSVHMTFLSDYEQLESLLANLLSRQ